MSKYVSKEEKRKIKVEWYRDQVATTNDIAARAGCSPNMAHKNYPFPRGKSPDPGVKGAITVRQAQALRYRYFYPGLMAPDYAARTGLSPNMFYNTKTWDPGLAISEVERTSPTGAATSPLYIAQFLEVEGTAEPEPTPEPVKPAPTNEAEHAFSLIKKALRVPAEPVDISKTLTEERGAVYGHPLDDFRRNAAAYEALDECKDVEVRHALSMVWVNVCRLVETPDHQDSIDDIKGYAETINMIHAERVRRGEG